MNQNQHDRDGAAGDQHDAVHAPPDPQPSRYSWLTHITAVLLFLVTFLLITVGGNVTSLDQGLAVPDGWTTFGYWTPIAPFSVWWDNMGARWEHSHRLFGNAVGILSIALLVLCIWRQRDRKWLIWSSAALLFMVIIQGTMGVYRVTELSTGLALLHGVFGQIILGMCVFMVAATGKVWLQLTQKWTPNHVLGMRSLRLISILMVILLLVQLLLGAGVRHSKSALAIPDFPTMYGQWWPPLTQEAITQKTIEYNLRDYSSSQVTIHFAHRVLAFGILVYGIAYFIMMLRKSRDWSILLGPAFTMINLLFLQVILGVLVIWSGDYPMNATVHQATGAALLAACVWAMIRIYLVSGQDLLAPELNRKTNSTKPSTGEVEGGIA